MDFKAYPKLLPSPEDHFVIASEDLTPRVATSAPRRLPARVLRVLSAEWRWRMNRPIKVPANFVGGVGT